MTRFKPYFTVLSLLLMPLLGACSTNPATGQQQFTALMSPQQEVQVGASEHQKIVKQFGLYQNASLTSYVNEVGKRVTTDTERPDVNYTFYVLDSPIVNAFALPGGYIYLSRGLISLANSEAEMAAVLAHEAGHITGRHSAERYSRGGGDVIGSRGALRSDWKPGRITSPWRWREPLYEFLFPWAGKRSGFTRSALYDPRRV